MQEHSKTLEAGEPRLLGRRQTLWLTGAGLSLIAVCYGLARFAYGLFVPAFRSEFALDGAIAGGIASGSYASYCVAIILSTVLTPRFGGRTVAVAAGVTATVGILVVASAPNAVVLAVGVLVAGSSTGVASPPLAHAVAHTVTASGRNRTQTLINAGTGVGVAVAGPVALLTHEQWRTAWLMFAIACAAATVWVAFAVPSGPVNGPGQASMTALLPRPLFPTGSNVLIAGAALMGVASSAVWTFGRDVLVSVGGLSDAASTIAWIFLGTFGVLGATAGDLVHRVGVGNGWSATMLVMSSSTWLLAALPSLPSVAWIAGAAFGAAYISLTGLLLIWGIEVYSQAPAAGVGLAFLVIALGQAVGAVVMGALLETSGAPVAFNVATAIALAGACLRPTKHRR